METQCSTKTKYFRTNLTFGHHTSSTSEFLLIRFHCLPDKNNQTSKNKLTTSKTVDIEFDLQWTLNIKLPLHRYNETCLNRPSSGTDFFVWNRQVFRLYRLNYVNFSTFRLYLKFSIHIIGVYSGFSLHRFHCTIKQCYQRCQTRFKM